MIVILRTRRRRPTKPPKPDTTPTPDQIDQMTAEIRKAWTPRERCRRSNTLGYLALPQMPLQPRRKGFWGDFS